MLNNSWFKKEKPFLRITGLGGVVSGLQLAGGLSYTEATGGMVSDYDASGTKYRAHIFTGPGTFTVSKVGSAMSGGVEYLVVGC